MKLLRCFWRLYLELTASVPTASSATDSTAVLNTGRLLDIEYGKIVNPGVAVVSHGKIPEHR